MKKKGFTLVELLAVIVILAIILAIAVPGISGLIDSARKNAFQDDVKMLIKAIDYKKLESNNFDAASVTEDNLNSTLGLSDSNYSDVVIKIIDGETSAEVVGSGKWDNYVACGTYKDMEVVKGTSCTTTSPNVSFAYTGSAQTYVIPESGYYKLQVWGASAGDNTNFDTLGGKGSYAEGEKYFDAGATIYIQVGGRGTDVGVADNTGDFLTNGGYNGGGDGAGAGPSGGGATDIRMLAGSWDDTASLNSRVIVAGGGGGNIGYVPSDGVTNYNGRAITSDYIYQLGMGQDGDITRHTASYPNDEPGAGGGYYGGTNMHGNWGNYGYGGTSYITGLLNEKVINGASSMLTPIGSEETGHSGNGYAIITFMSIQFEDKIPPSLVISGDDVLVLEPGESYTDQGATASDNIDGDMTSDITTVSTVDPNNPGDYTVTYTATDDSGKTTTKSRTVVVNYPPNAPVLAANMIPIMWSGTNWVKADPTNSNATYKWYNYSQKKWANAVTVTEATRSSYLSTSNRST
jgi:prepilin-type N-terminal cleavage/methylation domain-containing protein